MMEQILAEYFCRVDEAAIPGFVGLYLVGSVALGDFQAGSSDIDLLAILAEVPDPRTIRILATIHEAMAQRGTPHLDGVYATLDRLRRPERDLEPIPFAVDGVFHADRASGDLNPVLRQTLAEHGRTLRGLPVEGLGIPAQREATECYVRSNLLAYWRPWIDAARAAIATRGPDADVNAHALAQGILGVARIACTIETGEIVSKSAAGRWADRRFPYAEGTLAFAAAQRRDGIQRTGLKTAERALSFMEQLVEDYGALPGASTK